MGWMTALKHSTGNGFITSNRTISWETFPHSETQKNIEKNLLQHQNQVSDFYPYIGQEEEMGLVLLKASEYGLDAGLPGP